MQLAADGRQQVHAGQGLALEQYRNIIPRHLHALSVLQGNGAGVMHRLLRARFRSEALGLPADLILLVYPFPCNKRLEFHLSRQHCDLLRVEQGKEGYGLENLRIAGHAILQEGDEVKICPESYLTQYYGESMASEITRELLQTTLLADLPGWEVRLFLITYPPGANANNHSHPVVGVGFVLEGVMVSAFDDDPEETFGAGESFVDRASYHRIVRNGSNTKPMRFLISYTVKTGEPNTVFPKA
jgi:quercetin dioxygenase-like cupin family protein